VRILINLIFGSGADAEGRVNGTTKRAEVRDLSGERGGGLAGRLFAQLDGCVFLVHAGASRRAAIAAAGGVVEGRLADEGALRDTFVPKIISHWQAHWTPARPRRLRLAPLPSGSLTNMNS